MVLQILEDLRGQLVVLKEAPRLRGRGVWFGSSGERLRAWQGLRGCGLADFGVAFSGQPLRSFLGVLKPYI